MKKTNNIQWGAFSEKHKQYIRKAYLSEMSVAEGSIRSGKTIDHCIIAAMFLETCKDRLHLASGSSMPNAKLNIGDCNGYGLEHLFRGRCKWGKYKDNDALYIQTQTGEKIVIFAGGGKADSYKKILGNSYGLWIATEINEHYDCDDSRKSFISVAFGRQAAAKETLVLWDLNPCDPNDSIYKKYIDKYIGLSWYNYEHFTLHDNATITPDRLKKIESRYDKNSLWYKRDILGQRVIAEGLVYQFFGNNKDKMKVPNDYRKDELSVLSIGVDFGGNSSATTFSLNGIPYDFSELITYRCRRIKRCLTPAELDEEFTSFVNECYKDFKKLMEVYCDSEESTLIKGMKLLNLPVYINNARKGSINNRIKFFDMLQSQNRYKWCECCEDVAESFSKAKWDPKRIGERLDVVSFDNPIDMLDATEYSIEKYMNDLINKL